MAAARKKNQPTFNIFTGEADSPPKTREPLRETFRATFSSSQKAPVHTVLPTDPVNEDLRAQINTLKYELETAKRDNEMLRLEHQQEKRELEERAEAEFRRAQQADALITSMETKHSALQRELSEVQTRSVNERQDIEKRVRTSQEKTQQLQEEADELREDLASLQRQSEHKYHSLQTEHKALQETLDEIQAQLEIKTNTLHAAQRKAMQREAEAGELESEILRLKANSEDSKAVAVLKSELSEQVAHIMKLETAAREQEAELRKYRKQHKAIEVIEEEKRDLQSKVRCMDDLRRELGEAQLRKQALEDEKSSWTAYLDNEAGEDVQFETPEDLARAFIRERLEKTDLLDQLGQVKPELLVKDANIQTLEDEKARLQSELQQLRIAKSAGPDSNEAKARARLERQKTLATKEVEFLRAQVKAYDDEEREMQPEIYDATRAARVQQLEDLIDEYRKENDTLQKELNAAEKPAVTVAAGQKRSLDSEDADERIGELRRKNRQLQDEINESHKRIKVLETEYRAQNSQLKKLKEASRTRILELKSNPTADAEALKLSTVRTLREANAELLARLEGAQPSLTSVPLATLTAAQDELAELSFTVAEREKRIKRLKQIWTAKSLEFREAVASILGWKLDFMPNGRVRVTNMFYPGDEETGENSIVFDGENGTMKVSGGEQSAFANEIRDLITFWVEQKKDIPCFLAAMTLEFQERNTRVAR
jgi:mitotic spindle assembly checkpoint protein MAD1/[phosphatase 2A protein]-leucine-carboxy methyltransferase